MNERKKKVRNKDKERQGVIYSRKKERKKQRNKEKIEIKTN